MDLLLGLLLVAYAVFVCVLIGSATYVALRCPDSARRKDAYRVLGLLMGLGTGMIAVFKLLIGLWII